MTFYEMELAIKQLQNDLKNLASRPVTARAEEAKRIAINASNEIKNAQDNQNLTNSDLTEAITEIALLLGEEAAKHD